MTKNKKNRKNISPPSKFSKTNSLTKLTNSSQKVVENYLSNPANSFCGSNSFLDHQDYDSDFSEDNISVYSDESSTSSDESYLNEPSSKSILRTKLEDMYLQCKSNYSTVCNFGWISSDIKYSLSESMAYMDYLFYNEPISKAILEEFLKIDNALSLHIRTEMEISVSALPSPITPVISFSNPPSSTVPVISFGTPPSSIIPVTFASALPSSSVPVFSFGASSSSIAPVISPSALPSSSVPVFSFGASSSSIAPVISPSALPSSSVPVFSFGASSSSIAPVISPSALPSSIVPVFSFGASSSSIAPVISPSALPSSIVPVFSPSVLPLIATDDMGSTDDFLTYMYDHLKQPTSSIFMFSLLCELDERFEAVDLEVGDDPLWQFLDILNSYLIQRHKFLSQPDYLEALVACTCGGKASNELMDLLVALSQPSSSESYWSVVDELLFRSHLSTGTGPPEILPIPDGYLNALKVYSSLDNQSRHRSTFPTMFPAYMDYLNTFIGIYDEDDESTTSDSLAAMTVPTSLFNSSTSESPTAESIPSPLADSYVFPNVDESNVSPNAADSVAVCRPSTFVTVVARLKVACSSSPTVTVVARPLNAAYNYPTSVTVTARPSNAACCSSPLVNVVANSLNAACSSFTYVPVTESVISSNLAESIVPTSSSSVNPSHQVAFMAAWWEGCEGMSSGTTSPPPSPTSVATGISQLSPQTTTRIVPDDLSPFSWTSSVNLTISNSASSSLVNLTYLPNLIQEDVPTIIALRFPRLRKRRLTYKRSCCGQYWHIIDTLSPSCLPSKNQSQQQN